MTLFSQPRIDFEKVSNGWKAEVYMHPFIAHFIKLEGIKETDWMLDHIDLIKPMQAYLNERHSNYLNFEQALKKYAHMM